MRYLFFAICFSLPSAAISEEHWYGVSSSWIDALGYEDLNDNDPYTGYAIMALQNGHVFEYYEFSEDLFFDWLYASSVGEFYNTWIMDSFNYQRVQ